MCSPRQRAERLLAYAARHVPWWERALAGAPREWTQLPTMDRALVSARFDELVADRAVDRAAAMAQYRAAPAQPMRGGARVFVSAGARGEPVPLLYDAASWETYLRSLRRALAAAGAPASGTLALVGSDDPAHTLGRLVELLPAGRAVAIGLQDGVERACEWLERLRPDAIYGIASAIALVAARRPRIAPAAVLTGTDALDDDARRAIVDAFGVVPRASYGTTELGLIASACAHGGDMHVNEDAVLLEPGGGVTLATNLVNRLQPMIRFRLPEPVVLSRASCSCGGTTTRLRLHGGRTTPIWHVPGARGGTVALHPIVLRSALDPLLLPILPAVAVCDDGTLRVEVEAQHVAEAERRLVPALTRAGVDAGILVVRARR